MVAVVGVNKYLCRELGGASVKRGTYMLAWCEFTKVSPSGLVLPRDLLNCSFVCVNPVSLELRRPAIDLPILRYKSVNF